jgi:ribosomal protein L37AE/L43A
MSESDVPVIRALITGAWLCAACLAERTGLARTEAYETLNTLARRSPEFRTAVRRCDRCLSEKVVHRIG